MSEGAGDRAADLAAPSDDGSGALLWALHRISSLAVAAPEMGALLRESLAVLCDAGPWCAGHALIVLDKRLAGSGVFHGGSPALREACARVEFAPGKGLAGSAVQGRSTAWSGDLGEDPRGAALAAAGIRSEVVCPIAVGGEMAAALELFSTASEPPEARVLAMAGQAAALIGGVLERARAQRSPQLGDDMFRSLIEALPVGVVLADPQGKALYVNPAFVQIAGYGLKEMIDGSWREVVEPEHRERGAAAWRQVIETAQAQRQEYRTTRGGITRTVESLLGPMRGPGGELRGFVAVVEDLTAQIDAREALRESEDRFRAIFENAGVGLVLAVGDGDIVRANRAYARFLGYNHPDEVAGRNVREVLHPEDRARAQQMRNELRSGRTTRYEIERRYLRRDGTYVWGRSTVTKVADSPLIIAVVQDIDARKRAEDAVRALSGRFLRLQDEERRRIARSLHESAAQTVAALAMNLARMERMSLPPHAAETLADSLELVTQCSREIRTLSHLLHPPLLEEAGLPSSLRWYVEGFAQRSNVEVELHIADDLGRLPMELEITLFRIVQESLTNVHRHSESRSASIRLRRSGPEIVLEVEDQGIGIPGDVLERVRTQSSATVGVGIAGMRERLSQLGGTLEIAAASPGTLVRARIRSER